MPGMPNWGSFIFGFLFGIFITSVIFFSFATTEITLKIPTKGSKQKIADQRTVPPASKQSPTPVAEQAASEPTTVSANKEPRFDFYTELTKNSNDTNIVMPNKSKILDLKSDTSPINKYVVQVASFKHRSDADALKAKLTLNGYVAKLEIARLDNGELWHRVIIGPYRTEAKAYEQKLALKTLQIDSALVLKH